MKVKHRRKRRLAPRNWTEEIQAGNTDSLYKSTDWDIAREQALIRDKKLCQWYLGKFIHKESPKGIKMVKANTVHHIKPLKEYPELALDINNLVSLSFEAHEIIEGRSLKNVSKRKISKERW